MENNIKQGERLDDLQVKGYQIIQNPNKFCFGMDAVLLANFARVKKSQDWKFRKKVQIWQGEASH